MCIELFSLRDKVAILTGSGKCLGKSTAIADLSGVVVFLASSASDYVAGQVICVDGGFSIQ
ncbi:MAG TPA: SDR family oxidoreductase [Candidatus Wujingus californicus]|uniref:SDR family oxidoreductase n=1 Tax=Candidatus Wujingus californicus TaxID=3367618 RepID=UPI0027132618|nr:SDR family oxidoreductase [Candidatus Brocadiales bacterium]